MIVVNKSIKNGFTDYPNKFLLTSEMGHVWVKEIYKNILKVSWRNLQDVSPYPTYYKLNTWESWKTKIDPKTSSTINPNSPPRRWSNTAATSGFVGNITKVLKLPSYISISFQKDFSVNIGPQIL